MRMKNAHQHSPPRRPINLSLDAGLVVEARRHGLNLSAIAEEALRREVGEATATEWLAENRAELTAQAESADCDGLLSDAVLGWWQGGKIENGGNGAV